MLQKQFRCFCGPQGLNRLFEHSESEHLPEYPVCVGAAIYRTAEKNVLVLAGNEAQIR